jgi:cell division protein FtsQ
MNRKLIIRFASLVLVLAFISVTLGFTHAEWKALVVNDIQVKYTEDYKFVSEKEIKEIVSRNFKTLLHASLDTVNIQKIEDKIEENAWVKKAEVYKGYALGDSVRAGGAIIIKIIQENPVLRVVDETGGFYLDALGKKLPVSLHHTQKVMVVSGSCPDSVLTKTILPFVNHINTDKFWQSLFMQVHVNHSGELVLVPRVGNHQIEFGYPENVDQKLRNLKLVYTKGFTKTDFDKYKTLNLKYNNQVVCTLK